MYRYLIHVFSILFLFTFFSISIHAQEVFVGDVLEGQITNFKNKGVNIPLPPGKWNVDKSERHDSKTLNKGQKYWWNIKLYNYKDNGELHLRIQINPASGGNKWSGGSMERCQDWIKEAAKEIYAQGAERGSPQGVYCISERKDGYFHFGFETRTSRSPLYWNYYNLYYSTSSINRNQINNTKELKKIAEDAMKAISWGMEGRSGKLSNFRKFIKHSNNSSSLENLETSNETTSSTKVEISSSKEKLIELKSMLDEGLISQEQYDEKSSKIIDEF